MSNVITVQVKNNSKSKFNQFNTTSNKVVGEVRSRGWDMKDCVVVEVRSELVETVYRGVDGKTKTPTRQYLTRAKSTSNLNATKRVISDVLAVAV